MSEPAPEENDRRSSRKAAVLCLLLLSALFFLPGSRDELSSRPAALFPQPYPVALSADLSGEPDVQALPRDLQSGSCRTVAPFKLKPRTHFPLRPAFAADFCPCVTQEEDVPHPCGRSFAGIPALSNILNDSVPVRAGPAAKLCSSSLPRQF
ncbi:hypothetical protein [Victivallis sp.]|uniref:hypothetical protein n=1 Tax=Victivallis sp. TaxID=2049020 RepID=UPI003A901118